MNWAAFSLIVLAVEAWPACNAAYAQPSSKLLEVLPSILEQVAESPAGRGDALVGRDKRAIYQVPVRNLQLAPHGASAPC